jgi:transcriptional antiterminator NusG
MIAEPHAEPVTEEAAPPADQPQAAHPAESPLDAPLEPERVAHAEAPPAVPKAAAETPAEPAAGEAAETLTDEAEGESPAPAEPPPAADDGKKWYIVKVQSGRENSIKSALERRVKIEGLEEYVGQIKIPVEKVSELRNGKRVVRERKKFPGYLMVNVEFNDRVLYLFRETSGVGDFVGASITRAPNPMPAHEVERMLADDKDAAAGGAVKPKEIKLKFGKGDRVRVRDGTFSGMEGEVKDIVEPKDAKETVRVRIELTIFGRPVPVEVEAWQVDPV